MYFRLTKTKTSPVLQLVQSYRDQENRPRQKILLSLGNMDLPKTIWKEVAEEIETQLKGINTFIQPSKEVTEWAEKIVRELNKKEQHLQEKIQEPKEITVNPNDIFHHDTTELGPILPVMKAWEALNFEEMLSNVGFNPIQTRYAALSIMNRL